MPKTYYHGSLHLIEKYLVPHASFVLNGKKAVFASNERIVALIFIAKWSDRDIEFGFHGGKKYLIERYPKAFNLFKTDGYLYHVDSSDFKSDARLGMKNAEFICSHKVKILNTEYIKNVWNEIKKSDVAIITFQMKMKALEKYM